MIPDSFTVKSVRLTRQQFEQTFAALNNSINYPGQTSTALERVHCLTDRQRCVLSSGKNCSSEAEKAGSAEFTRAGNELSDSGEKFSLLRQVLLAEFGKQMLDAGCGWDPDRKCVVELNKPETLHSVCEFRLTTEQVHEVLGWGGTSIDYAVWMQALQDVTGQNYPAVEGTRGKAWFCTNGSQFQEMIRDLAKAHPLPNQDATEAAAKPDTRTLRDFQVAVRDQIVAGRVADSWCVQGVNSTLVELGLPTLNESFPDEEAAKAEFIARVHRQARIRVDRGEISLATARRRIAQAGLPQLPDPKKPHTVKIEVEVTVDATNADEARIIAKGGLNVTGPEGAKVTVK